MTKICDVCGAEFVPARRHESTQKYCSKTCSRTADLIRRRKANAEKSSVGKPSKCKICGREFVKKYGVQVYCSDECKSIGFEKNIQKANQKASAEHAGRDRSRARRGSQEYTKKCIVCGKVFTTWFPQKKTCSEGCKNYNATVVKRERDRIRSRYRKITPEEQHAQWIRRRYGSEENYQKWLAEQEALKQKRERERLAEKESHHCYGECVVCGKTFETYNPRQKTCSKTCGRRYANARKQNRIPKEQIIDSDITLEALYRRDSGVCYLCGKQCDWNDKDENKVGPNYPSIDHLIPVARGGLHSWSNVRLAHFKCNADKSDAILPNVRKMIPTNAYQFKQYKRDPRKRTAQYTHDGHIVAVFSSTAEAEKVTGIKQRGIQNCARGESKSYGGFVWKYE